MEQALELGEVKLLRLDPELVAAGAGDEGAGFVLIPQQPSQPGDGDPQGAKTILMSVRAEQLLYQPVGADDLVRAQQEKGEQAALTLTTKPKLFAVSPCLDWSEKAKPKRRGSVSDVAPDHHSDYRKLTIRVTTVKALS